MPVNSSVGEVCQAFFLNPSFNFILRHLHSSLPIPPYPLCPFRKCPFPQLWSMYNLEFVSFLTFSSPSFVALFLQVGRSDHFLENLNAFYTSSIFPVSGTHIFELLWNQTLSFSFLFPCLYRLPVLFSLSLPPVLRLHPPNLANL